MSCPRLGSVVASVLVLTFIASAVPAGATGRSEGSSPMARRPPQVTIVAAGDISPEGGGHDDETARLLRRIDPTAVLTLGDHQYPAGSLDDFRRYYDETWGAFRDRTYPTPGNHDCETAGCAGYFSYFGGHAKDGTYRAVLGRWLIVSLNRYGHDQRRALRRFLVADHHRCELVFWHPPRWSSSSAHGSSDSVAGWWETAYRHGVDVILNGHDHVYERFARLTPAGEQARDGIREFVVGTGGAELYGFGEPEDGSKVRLARFGVLQMTLAPRSYAWSFRAVGEGEMDAGSTGCHR